MARIENKTTVVMSQELKKELDKLGNKGDTYNDIIWKLVKSFQKKKGKSKELF